MRLRLLSAFAVSLALAGPIAAPRPVQASPAVELDAGQQALVQRATDYLQTLKSVTGRFTQSDANGGTSSGTLYLQRPGKARFEYDPPSGLLVQSDGQFVSVSDTRLKTFNEYPLGRTPLSVLLARQVRFDHGVTVTGVDQTSAGFSITARSGQAAGRLTLLFGDQPMALRGWNLVDAQGRRTEVRLGPLTPTGRLAPGLFYIRDPRH